MKEYNEELIGCEDGFEKPQEEFNLEGLFSGKNDGNVLPEVEAETIIKDFFSNSQNGFRYSFEDLHCTEYDKYLVPLFILKGDEGSFIGNGVIVDNYLLTAAHVVVCNMCKRNLNHIYYRVERDYIEVNNDMLIHDGRDPFGKVVHDMNNIHDDLIVYKLKEKYNSFKLSEEPVSLGDELAIRPYRRNLDNDDEITSDSLVCKVSALKKGRLKNQEYDWYNCYITKNGWQEYSGNSGSALFNKETVFGILITVNRTGFIGTAIEAKYISDVISEYEANHKE